MSSSPSSSLRKRGGRKEAYSPLPSDDASSPLSSSKPSVASTNQSGWDYRLALVVLTILAFITRFYKISYPNEVVFDEVHFGKVSEAVPPYSAIVQSDMGLHSLSSLRTTYKELISSMCTLHLANCSSLSWGG